MEINHNRLIEIINDFDNKCTSMKIPKSVKGSKRKRLIYFLISLLDAEQDWFISTYHTNEAVGAIKIMANICREYHVPLLNLFRETEIKHIQKGTLFKDILEMIKGREENVDTIWLYMKGVLGYILYRYHFSVNSLPLEKILENMLLEELDAK